MNIVNGPKSNN